MSSRIAFPARLRPTAATAPAEIEHYRRRRVSLVLLMAVVAAFVLPAVATSRSDAYQVNVWLLYSIAALGFYWMFCLGGKFAFSQAFLMGLGGFVSAAVTQGGERSFLWGVVVAVATTAALGAALGWVLRGCGEFYFALGTFAFVQLGSVYVQNNDWIGGQHGTQFGLAPPTIGDRVFLSDQDVFWLILAVLTVCMIAAALIERSPARRTALAARTNPLVSALSGVSVRTTPIMFLALGSALGGLSGAILAHWQGSVALTSYGPDLAIGILLMVMLGGTGSIWGPVIGAGVYVFLPTTLTGLEQYSEVVYGALLLICIVAAPSGIAGGVERVWRYLSRRLRRGRRSTDVAG